MYFFSSRFDKADCGAILFKLKEFNCKIDDINLRVTDNELEAVMMLADQVDTTIYLM